MPWYLIDTLPACADGAVMGVITFENISNHLRKESFQTLPDNGKTHAAVAMIISFEDLEPEILFIQRASHALDPWSGHIALPGGKIEPREMVCEAARRETMEEIGVILKEDAYMGKLSDVVGSNLPVRVSCCVYGVERSTLSPKLSGEVKDLFWTRVSDLADRSRHVMSLVSFAERNMEVMSIALPYPRLPVLWGITYRLVMQFLEIVEKYRHEVAMHEDGCTLPEAITLNEEELR